jgi:hypothetical protein
MLIVVCRVTNLNSNKVHHKERVIIERKVCYGVSVGSFVVDFTNITTAAFITV